MGDKGDNEGTYSGDTAANIALNYYNESQGLRKKVLEFLNQGLWRPEDQTKSPIYRAGRDQIEDQYGVARENIMATMPQGGQLLDKLADTETSRADALGNLSAASFEDVWNKAFQYSTGAPSTSMSTLSNVAGSEAALQAQNSQNKTNTGIAMGYGLGMK